MLEIILPDSNPNSSRLEFSSSKLNKDIGDSNNLILLIGIISKGQIAIFSPTITLITSWWMNTPEINKRKNNCIWLTSDHREDKEDELITWEIKISPVHTPTIHSIAILTALASSLTSFFDIEPADVDAVLEELWLLLEELDVEATGELVVVLEVDPDVAPEELVDWIIQLPDIRS